MRCDTIRAVLLLESGACTSMTTCATAYRADAVLTFLLRGMRTHRLQRDGLPR